MEHKRSDDAPARAPIVEPERPQFRRDLAGLERSLLERPATVAAADRRAAAAGRAAEPALGRYLERVQAEAYRVTDEEVAGLRRGRSDDELFELTVSAAYGAARRRLDAGLAAVAAAFGDAEE